MIARGRGRRRIATLGVLAGLATAAALLPPYGSTPKAVDTPPAGSLEGAAVERLEEIAEVPDGHAPAGWREVFAEEFDGDALDAATWHTCHWWAPTTCTVETHKELSLYTRDNVEVADGVLTLTARRERAVGWNGQTFEYTSGLVSTGGSPYSTPRKPPGFVFRYGYAEARIKVPAGRGLVPAFWLPMADHEWPPEIDILEIVGHRPKGAHMHYHYKRANGTRAGVGKTWTGPDLSAGWHTFGVDWRRGSLTWYVDGVARFNLEHKVVTDKPAYLVLNLAVGGNWPGSPDADTAFPAQLLVDWVRVHQRPEDVGSLGAD